MAVTILNITLEAGIDYYLNTTYTDFQTNLPKDLTGYTAVLELKSSEDSPQILLRLGSDNGRILLSGTTGTIVARFLPADTNPSLQAPYAWNRAVYDLVLTDPLGVKVKLLKGFINVSGTMSI